MRSKHWIQTVDTHTEGEPTRIVTAGLGPIPGDTMAEKRRHVRENMDHLRTALLSEPRGHKDMYGCILTPPAGEDADFGALYIHNSGYMDMCGHATIGVATALVETGMVQATEPETRLVLDTPGGPVKARVSVRGGGVESVSFENVPAYVYETDASLEVDGIGELAVDLAYGGNDFVCFSAEQAGLVINPSEVAKVIDVGTRVLDAANRSFPIEHPGTGERREFNIASALTNPSRAAPAVRNVHVFGPRQFDRSPGGTGTSAHLAVWHAKGELGIGEELVVESGITDGVFRGRILEATEVGGRSAVVTEVTGAAHITGFHQFVIDPEDPLAEGFLIEEV